MKRKIRILFPVLFAIASVAALPAAARNPDGTLSRIRYPLSTRPALVLAGGSFTMEIQNSIDVNTVVVELVRDGEAVEAFRSDPRDVFPTRERAAYDLPSWDCLVDGWKMSWMWRPRVVVRDLVAVPVILPATLPAGFYDLHMRSSAGADTSRRAVRVYETWPTSYTIGHITDSHIGRDKAEYPARMLERVAERMNALGADFVLCTGDNTQDNFPHEHAEFIRLMDRFEMPTFVVGGNHDTGGFVYEGHADPLLYIGDPYYSFDFGDHHYTGIDNATRHFDEVQVAWVREDVARNLGRAMRVVFGHCLYLQSQEDQHWFNNEFFPENRIALHLFGHIHQNTEEKKFDGLTTWMTTGPSFEGHLSIVRIEDDRVVSVTRHRCEP